MTTEIDEKALAKATSAVDAAIDDHGEFACEAIARAAILAYLAATLISEAAEPAATGHEWEPSPYGHGSARCKHCKSTLEELIVLGEPDRCAFAPLPSPVSEEVTATHRHKKRGTEYVLIGMGRMQAEKWERITYPAGVSSSREPVDMREVAIYRSVDDGSLWARPREEFEDGRFEALASLRSPKP